MKLKTKLKKLFRNTRSEKNYRDINYEMLVKLIKSGNDVILIDVRSPQEFAENKINCAINIPLYEISESSVSILPNKRTHIILYCQSGTRSKKACNILARMGYVNLYNLDGGLDAVW